MAEAIRTTAMRGFSCPVSRTDPLDERGQGAGIAVGSNGEGADRRIAVAIRHADGTTVCAYLSEDGVDRLAHRLADLVGAWGASAPVVSRTLQ